MSVFAKITIELETNTPSELLEPTFGGFCVKEGRRRVCFDFMFSAFTVTRVGSKVQIEATMEHLDTNNYLDYWTKKRFIRPAGSVREIDDALFALIESADELDEFGLDVWNKETKSFHFGEIKLVLAKILYPNKGKSVDLLKKKHHEETFPENVAAA